MRDRRGHGSCAKPLRTRFRTGPTPVLSFTERRTDDNERSAQRNRATESDQAQSAGYALTNTQIDMETSSLCSRLLRVCEIPERRQRLRDLTTLNLN